MKVTANELLDDMLEMANIGPRTHQLGVEVILHLYQPGDKKLPHAPRVKVFRRDPHDTFSITLEEEPKVIEGESFLSGKDLNKLLSGIKKYRKAFLSFWNDSLMSVDELTDLMRKTDRK